MTFPLPTELFTGFMYQVIDAVAVTAEATADLDSLTVGMVCVRNLQVFELNEYIYFSMKYKISFCINSFSNFACLDCVCCRYLINDASLVPHASYYI